MKMTSSQYFDVSNLNGKNGFTISGLKAKDFLGSSVSRAGDINGDGKADIIIGAPRVDHAEPDVALGKGEAYVIFGSSSFQSSFDLSKLDGNNGFAINGLNQDMLGYSVSGAGDVNGDGKADIIIGAPYSSFNSLTNAGQAYVIFGSSSFQSSFNLSNLNGNNGFVVNGLTSGSRLAYSVSGAGDINGDGKADIIIGAPYSSFNSLTNAGQTYVIFGSSSFQSSFNLSNLNGNNGFVVNGLTSGDMLGASVGIGGDVNGDGKADIIIGANHASPNGSNMSGQAYVIFGSSSFQSPFNLNSINGNNGFVVNGLLSGDMLGASVGIGGDVNDDKKADIIIGADHASPNNSNTTGQAYVIFGSSSFQSPFNLNSLNGNNGFIINGLAPEYMLGYQVNIIGDINKDSKSDIIVGSVHANPKGVIHAGQTYILYGSSSFQSPFNLSSLNGKNGFIVNGLGEHHALGWGAAGAGDVNGDGKADILISAPDASKSMDMAHNMPMESKEGQVYVIFDEQSAQSSSAATYDDMSLTVLLGAAIAITFEMFLL